MGTLPPEEFERRLGHGSIIQAGETDREGIDRDVLRAQVKEARELGYGVNLGTTWSGLNAVSTVLTVETPESPGLQRVAGCLVTVGSFSPERAHEIGRRMLEISAEMSNKLSPLLRAVNLHFPLSRPLMT
jgi:DNA-binding IclR family transcriptional regulator